MKNILKFLFLSLFIIIASVSYGETDAFMNGSATTTGVQTAMKVINVGAFTHVLSYVAVGTTASISIRIEGSTDNGATYSICGSASTTLPVPATPVQCTGIYDHIRVNITILTGASPQVLFSLYSSTLSGGTGAAATQVQGSAGVSASTSGLNPLTMGMVRGNGTNYFVKSQSYVVANDLGSSPADDILTTGGAWISYSPTQLGVNALTLPASTNSALSNIIDMRGVKQFTIYWNCTQISGLMLQPYLEDGTTVAGSLNGYTTSVAVANTYSWANFGSETNHVSNVTTANLFLRLPLRALAFAFNNGTATPGTCTARLMLSY